MFFILSFQYHCNWRAHCEIAMVNLEKLWNHLRDMKTTLERTVIIWGEDDVLTRAVEDLLGTGGDWKVIRVNDDLDELSLAQLVERVTPDVLIVHGGVLSGNVRPLISFVQDYPQLKIITIGLENNKMEIYDKKTVCIKESSDLLAAIKNGAAPEEV